MHISHPFHSTTNLNMFPLHCISQILCAETESLDKWLIIHSKKFFPTTQCLTRVGPTSVIQTDRWTHDNSYHRRLQRGCSESIKLVISTCCVSVIPAWHTETSGLLLWCLITQPALYTIDLLYRSILDPFW